jgi:hypothetical protein
VELELKMNKKFDKIRKESNDIEEVEDRITS